MELELSYTWASTNDTTENKIHPVDWPRLILMISLFTVLYIPR